MFEKITKINTELSSFFVPKNISYRPNINLFDKLNIIVIIPTYKPSYLTKKLVNSISKWYQNVKVVVVDDSAGQAKGRYEKNFQELCKLSKQSRKIHYIKSPKNLYKSGALNYGIEYAKKMNRTKRINAIVTMDDDVIISKKTLPILINKLYSSYQLGAVCSTVRVKNKNKNLLTRLQGLEYHNFNVIKLSDNGFLRGPLVMQGMISAFKFTVFSDVKGYFSSNLIEDYEITANLKKHKWSVAFVHECWAWTNVPSQFESFWKQRARWTYWGLEVIKSYLKDIVPVFQDLIGHVMFMTMLILIALSLIISSPSTSGRLIVAALLGIAFLNILISYSFGLYTLRFYRDANWKDRLLRFSIIPEMIYGNIMSMILFGSYLFYGFNALFQKGKRQAGIYKAGARVFAKFGYLLTWGTRDLKIINLGGGDSS